MAMTFKGMLKIVMNDYKKQHEAKMFAVVNELLQTRRELNELKEQLRSLQLNSTPTPSETSTNLESSINLLVQYNGLAHELRDIHPTMTIRELLIRLRAVLDISLKQSIHVRVLSDDGLTTFFLLDHQSDEILELNPGMIFQVEDDDDDMQNQTAHQFSLPRSKSITSSERTHSCESDV